MHCRQSASFRCPQEDCEGDGDFIRLHVAGASESSTIKSNLYCAVCGHKLEENMKYRNLGGDQYCMYQLVLFCFR